jgi:peptide/nickel transport system ATP-binding protein
MSENASKKLLNVSNISISFIRYTNGLKQNIINVINDLSLDVFEGEIISILGSSGSGKSLLAHAILGILPENAILDGTMEFNGELLDQELKEKLRGSDIALIPQSVNFLDPLMKVSNQVIGATKNEEDKKEKQLKQKKIFKEYGLNEDVGDLYPFQLSGGMARRVLISTALLSNPKIVIADEPTPGLDEKSIEETLSHLKQMADSGIGIILISHDINATLNVSDRIAIFYSGYLIEINKAENFSSDGEKLLHPYTKALYKALPENGFHLFKGHQPLHKTGPNKCIYYDRCPYPIDKCSKSNPELYDLEDKKIRCYIVEEKYKANPDTYDLDNKNKVHI